MPFLMIKTNIDLEKTTASALLNQASKVIHEITKKPEDFIMVNVCSDEYMLFANKTSPCVYMEMKSVGMTKEQVPLLAKGLTEMIEFRLKVPANRIYIEFAAVPGVLWGYNGETL